ncbi:hypothetical protein ACW73L_05435 [Methylolobus aquaticus]
MNQIDRLAELLKTLERTLHESGCSHLRFNQQRIAKENMSFSGANGRIWIQPVNGGYDISISGKGLTSEVTPALVTLCGRKCDGYKQTNKKLGKAEQPYWRVTDFGVVKAAVELYAKTKK